MADKETLRKEYETGKYTFKQLADKFNISQGTIKSWAKRDKDNGQPWKKVATKTKNQNKKVAVKVAVKKEAAEKEKEPVFEEVEEVLKNPELTDKQRLFCIYYTEYFNATKAYRKSYGCTYEAAMVCGNRLLRNVKIKAQIEKLKQGKLNRAMLSPDDLFQKYIDIAFSDTNDYTEYGTKEITMINKKGEEVLDKQGNPVKYKINYVSLKDSKEVDGSLISEVSQGKDGVKVKLLDKMRALEWLTNHMDIATEEQSLRMERLRAEVENLKGGSKNDEAKTWADTVQEIAAKRRGKDG